MVCNKGDRERVVGLHILGPNAGEITQVRKERGSADAWVGVAIILNHWCDSTGVCSGNQAGGYER